MRSDLGEVKARHTPLELLRAARQGASRIGSRRPSATLEPVAVDEAFADETTAFGQEESSSRQLVGAAVTNGGGAIGRVLDAPFKAAEPTREQAPDNSAILRELADRLADLQRQQSQIEQLLVSVERR